MAEGGGGETRGGTAVMETEGVDWMTTATAGCCCCCMGGDGGWRGRAAGGGRCGGGDLWRLWRDRG